MQVFEPGETIILLHQWPSDSDPPDEPGARHENGILIWLAPAPLGGPWDKYRLPKPTGSTPPQN
ncbi:hypothetical protein [Bremerella sp.]|uniref:hypothetical protein n=1 Tax=Bremerella sp. TaxID=2795602 RepID=UPI00391965C5